MDVTKFLAKAEAALRKRAAPQAIALYKQVLVASPDHAGARAGLLDAYRRKAELKGGPGMLDRAAAKSLRVTAQGLRGAGQHALVIKNCEAGLEKDPGDTTLLGMLAEALAAAGRPAEAVACWEHRLARDERDAEALKAAGRLHYELHQVDQAIALLDRYHALDAHDPEVEKLRKHLVAEGTLSRTKFETAASSRELIKDPGALPRAEASQRLHRTSDELAGDIAGLAERVEAEPDDLDLRRQLARSQLRAGDTDAARATVAAGRERLPDDESLQDLAGDVELAANKAALAAAKAAGDVERSRSLADQRAALEIEEFGRRVRARPGETALRLRLARACYRSGRTDEAIEHFQALVADPRVELEAREGLGACFFRKGLLPLAERQFSGALEKAGGVAGDRGKEICYSLGLVQERLEKPQEALARYMEIYEVDIHFKDVATKIEALSG